MLNRVFKLFLLIWYNLFKYVWIFLTFKVSIFYVKITLNLHKDFSGISFGQNQRTRKRMAKPQTKLFHRNKYEWPPITLEKFNEKKLALLYFMFCYLLYFCLICCKLTCYWCDVFDKLEMDREWILQHLWFKKGSISYLGEIVPNPDSFHENIDLGLDSMEFGYILSFIYDLFISMLHQVFWMWGCVLGTFGESPQNFRRWYGTLWGMT